MVLITGASNTQQYGIYFTETNNLQSARLWPI